MARQNFEKLGYTSVRWITFFSRYSFHIRGSESLRGKESITKKQYQNWPTEIVSLHQNIRGYFCWDLNLKSVAHAIFLPQQSNAQEKKKGEIDLPYLPKRSWMWQTGIIYIIHNYSYFKKVKKSRISLFWWKCGIGCAPVEWTKIKRSSHYFVMDRNTLSRWIHELKEPKGWSAWVAGNDAHLSLGGETWIGTNPSSEFASMFGSEHWSLGRYGKDRLTTEHPIFHCSANDSRSGLTIESMSLWILSGFFLASMLGGHHTRGVLKIMGRSR